MSNYCIVYSIHSDKQDIDNLLQWRELLFSLKTLRSVNKEVNVKVYVSPPDRINNITMFPDMKNLEIIPIKNPNNNYSILGKEVAMWLEMKYSAAFHTLDTSSYDKVLMIDPDTIYYKDPNTLVEKYQEDVFYSAPDDNQELFNYLETDKRYMNDGVVIVPRWSLGIKDELLLARYSFTNDILNKHKDAFSDEDIFWRNSIGWASPQYGIYEYLLNANRPVKYFDSRDVANLADWNSELPPTILHYWHIGYQDHLPKEYWPDIDDTHMTKIHQKV